MFKTKNTGRAIAISAIVVCVCFAMLLGTTFAWFTSTAATKVNTITTGKFEIDIVEVDSLGNITTNSLKNETLPFVYYDSQGAEHEYTGTILWEPNMTIRTQTFAIVNKGVYALNFKIDDVFANAVNADNRADNVTANIMDVVSYTVYKWSEAENKFVPYVYTEIETDKIGESITLYPNDNAAGYASAQKFYVEITMDYDAGNKYQECALSNIAVSVSASQATYENDSYGTSYDTEAVFDEFVDPWETTTQNS